MASFFSYILDAAATILAVPVIIFVSEIVAALVPPGLAEISIGVRRRIAILVPAHDEGSGILPTLQDIRGQLSDGDRLLVVADNCGDDTAAVALAAGAEVIERHDAAKIGKGYALDFGLNYLSHDPPATVIVIDADCRVADRTIERLATTCAATGRPVQALDLMVAAESSPVNYHVAEFAWRVKNWLRPLGLRALNFPCQLMGTGMAFPWELIRSVDLRTGSIVEDIELGLHLAQKGSPALFCPSAVVTSRFPLSVEGAESQRKRWEGGHIGVILSTLPGFFCRAIMRRNLALLVLSLDLAVPPLSLLVFLLVGTCFVASGAALFGVSSAALMISGTCLVAMASAIILAWIKYGRDLVTLSAIPLVVSYIFAKLPIYRQFLSGTASSSWIRAERKNDE